RSRTRASASRRRIRRSSSRGARGRSRPPAGAPPARRRAASGPPPPSASWGGRGGAWACRGRAARGGGSSACSGPAAGGAFGRDAAPAATETRRAIVVSEDSATLAGVSWALSHAGFEALSAREAEEAVDVLRDQRYDVMAVDLLLGGVGAIDLVATVRASGAS